MWFEAGRIAWLDAVGVPYAEIAAAGYHFAVIGVEVDYRTPGASATRSASSAG
ncbi:MAG: hypothetical protein H6644_11875 [Caldilineaceae bacterium]|nr:hypothetical protein [Caldilineaceae bacterium]